MAVDIRRPKTGCLPERPAAAGMFPSVKRHRGARRASRIAAEGYFLLGVKVSYGR